ncbi:dTDP-4-dehydrorhamnose 3,5-epimerase [Sphingomonas sp. NFR15]|uniref:dTDP-4-dehydrorhamnose 3,5-epimerase n=1 Tax=Sphingomonas sp. NFR15 TaxID=1566282 RepID=UPI0008839E56|nr:dTDP-4-dehydrorhamnose 3,5-epimerase [Sphingomonas sp. NFR15]SDA35497.1 dTDP-4-dehydrorhamnose 3,5-epimerase [Sphingomonas sp. NFR15]
MKIIATGIPDLLIVEPVVFDDDRGFFFESWNAARFTELGLGSMFVQDNHSRSARAVLRGLHYQDPNAQGKLVRVTAGRAWDVAVDLRRSSTHFGKWFGLELSAANKRMFWVPPGFAHGFLSLAEDTDVLYKCTSFYDPASERVLMWNDPDLAIEWPIDGFEPRLSGKDTLGGAFADIQGYP